ncbi:meiotic recombination [Sorochytrium milnesiophthora]
MAREAEVDQPEDAPAPENTIRILIATDNHLGYLEKDPVRGGDSLNTFEEILRIAQEREVDMVLLGGDLFHDNKPSRRVLHSTLELFRTYCMGGRPCPLEILSDQSVNFPNRFATVNYQDPNLNISMPVFSIHGNHDDPSGDGNLSALDLVSITGLVNYFGKCKEVDDISVSPVLLRKGTTQLALYGLGNVRDERLHRTFLKGNVKMLRPREDPDAWFNLMVFHQNRVPHGKTNFIPESFLDPFLHLVLWGHEHECLVDPAWNAQQEFHITQPGSSVATSLSEGESREKHVALLSIHDTSFELEKVRLRSVRPFIMDELVLSADTGLRPTETKRIQAYIVDRVETLIQSARHNWLELNAQDGAADAEPDEDQIPLPLVRLRVEYGGGFSTFNPQRFGQQFVGKVANPKDVLLFYRKRTAHEPSKGRFMSPVGALLPERLNQCRVEDLVTDFLNLQELDLLPENQMNDMLRVYVEKHDNDAIQEFVGDSLGQVREKLKDSDNARASGDGLIMEIAAAKKQRKAAYAEETNDDGFTVVALRKKNTDPAKDGESDAGDSDHENFDELDDDEAAAGSRSKANGSKAPRAAATTRGRGRGRGAAAAARGSSRTAAQPAKRKRAARAVSDDDDDDDGDDDVIDMDEDDNDVNAQ